MGADNIGKGRLRSIWTHKVDMSQLQSDGGSAGYTDADYAQLAGIPAQKQDQLHDVPWGASSSAGGCSAGDETPRKLAPALSLLQHEEQQHSSSRSRPVFSALDREILCNALACAGASMADPLMSMVDSYHAGKLGTTALAALGSNGALYSVLYFFCFTALAVLCTQAMASANSRGDSEGCGRGFIQAVAATLVVSSCLVLLLLLAPEYLLGWFQTDPEVLALAKTYCMIRALSLPAALGMNVCQAAFRSLLDLTTPFCVVMTANAANYLLDNLFMVQLPYGMAGCGWASVISQYLGAALFAGIIYRRRHKFGIPEALACAEDRYYEQQELLHAAGQPSSSVLVAKRLSSGGKQQQHHQQHAFGGDGSHPDAAHPSSTSPAQLQQQAVGLWQRLTGGGAAAADSRRHSRSKSKESIGGKGISPRRSRESSGSLRIDVTAFEQLTKRNGGGPSPTHDGSAVSNDCHVVHSGGGVKTPGSPNSPARRRGSRLNNHKAGAAAAAAASSSGGGAMGTLSAGSLHHRHIHQQQWDGEGPAAPDAGPAGSSLGGGELRQGSRSSGGGGGAAAAAFPEAAGLAGNPEAAGAAGAHCGGNNGSNPAGVFVDGNHRSYHLHRWDSTGSDSKLPRYLMGGSSSSTLWRLMVLLRSLDWGAFVRKFAGMTTRGMLILSTYTSANMVAGKGGTVMMAAHQVVQQQQQLQMSFAWSFLHVGQSMTANLYHSTTAAGGPKAARRLSERIVRWAIWSCGVLAAGTYACRHRLPTIFTRDVKVQQLAISASLPAAVMLGLGWNNALEGCLLAADDQPFVVKMYPWAVAAALTQLARGYVMGSGLPGVWLALMSYYLVLLLGFAARYWVYRRKL